MITNDVKYLKDVGGTNGIDSNYTCHQGALLQKADFGWNIEKIQKKGFEVETNTKILKQGKKVHWTSVGQYAYRLNLKNNYTINWQEYSDVQGATFWYCIIEVLPDSKN
jgi:hypothetical protein